MSLKYDTTRWSPQLEESCNKLDQSALAGDKVLVALTRISKVAVDATDTLQRLTERSDYGPGLLLHIKALRTLLDNVRSGLTAEQLRNSKYPHLLWTRSRLTVVRQGPFSPTCIALKS
jgi:hypothetical protein